MIHWNIRSIKWSSSTFGRLSSNERRWYRPPHHMQSSLSNPDAHLEQSLVATLPNHSEGKCNQTSSHQHDPNWVKVLALFDENIKCQRFSSIYPSTPCNVPHHRGVTVLWQRPIVVRHGKRVKMSYDVSRHHVLFWNFSKYLWLASKSCRTSGSNNLLKNCVTLVVQLKRFKKKH